MARSLASTRQLGTAAIALAALCGAASAPAPHAAGALRVRAVASHAPGAAAAWGGDPARVYDELARRRARLAPADPTRIARVILEESLATALDPLLVLAVIRVESAYDPRAVSPAGAQGLMQLMPPTMREQVLRSRLGKGDPLDPIANVRAGVRYLARLVGAFDDVELALMAYNAGPARIRGHLRAGGVPARFLAYPRAVLLHLERLSPPSGEAVASAHRAPSRAHTAAAHRRGARLAGRAVALAPRGVLDRETGTAPAAPSHAAAIAFAEAPGLALPKAPAAVRAPAPAWRSVGPIARAPARDALPPAPLRRLLRERGAAAA